MEWRCIFSVFDTNIRAQFGASVPGVERDVATVAGTQGDEPSSASSLLLVVMEHGALSRFQLPSSGAARIGRAEDSDVVLRGAAASRAHALLHIGPTLAIEDLGSRNGTLLRGTRLAAGERIAIKIGEPVHIGSTILVVQYAPSVRAAPLAASSDSQRREIDPAVVIRDPVMLRVYEILQRVAPSTIGILILGETGVGKEVVATTVHRLSGARSKGPFVCINCAALNTSVFESEVFGHQQGSFTGAVKSKPGLLETADKGTVFLDEVGELPWSVQAKLLRVIETREITRVGGLKPQAIDVRFVAATNRDLRAEIQAGSFREDLFFRLNGVSVRIPPLRERPAEIEFLVQSFLSSIAAGLGAKPPTISVAAMQLLTQYSWPGNVRELRNAVECAVLLSAGNGSIEPMHLPPELADRSLSPNYASTIPGQRSRTPAPRSFTPDSARNLPAVSDEREQSERDRIIAALAAFSGNQTRAAEYLAMPRRTLVSKLTAYGLPRPRKSSPPEG